jgi:hypothetical protein
MAAINGAPTAGIGVRPPRLTVALLNINFEVAMKLLTEYLERAVSLERMAADEPEPEADLVSSIRQVS